MSRGVFKFGGARQRVVREQVTAALASSAVDGGLFGDVGEEVAEGLRREGEDVGFPLASSGLDGVEEDMGIGAEPVGGEFEGGRVRVGDGGVDEDLDVAEPRRARLEVAPARRGQSRLQVVDRPPSRHGHAHHVRHRRRIEAPPRRVVVVVLAVRRDRRSCDGRRQTVVFGRRVVFGVAVVPTAALLQSRKRRRRGSERDEAVADLEAQDLLAEEVLALVLVAVAGGVEGAVPEDEDAFAGVVEADVFQVFARQELALGVGRAAQDRQRVVVGPQEEVQVQRVASGVHGVDAGGVGVDVAVVDDENEVAAVGHAFVRTEQLGLELAEDVHLEGEAAVPQVADLRNVGLQERLGELVLQDRAQVANEARVGYVAVDFFRLEQVGPDAVREVRGDLLAHQQVVDLVVALLVADLHAVQVGHGAADGADDVGPQKASEEHREDQQSVLRQVLGADVPVPHRRQRHDREIK
mmetsp:Transcript_18885/g.58173  ORF Transcript_18885/g.58173 Transcript_18885/m.58173 type:complete len:467 (-) Transcript_18885:919-2319(-)